MSLGIVGKKRGMTRVFASDGASVAATVIEASPNRVTRLKTPESDGYSAVQVAWGGRRRALINKPSAGLLAKAEVDSAEGLAEFRLDANAAADLAPGKEIKVDIFQAGQKVDVSGVTIGKGFAGVLKRHLFTSQRASHGNSLSHRVPGSIGQRQSPGKVFRGKRMPGHLGNVNRTAQNLEVLRIDPERNLLLIKGAVPGPRGGRVMVSPSVKVAR